MSDYDLFAFSISKYPLIKLEELISDSQIGIRLNKTGSDLGRTIQMCTNLRLLTNDIIDKLPLTVNGPQNDISYDFNKIDFINTLLQENILKHDQMFPSNQCCSHFNDLSKTLKDIQQIISQITSNTSSSIAQRLEILNENLTSVVGLYDSIISTSKKCENELIQKVPQIPSNEHHISYQMAASLTAFEELLIQLYFLTTNSIVRQSNHFEKLNNWIAKGKSLRQKLFESPRSDESQILRTVIDISMELSNLSGVIAEIQSIIPDSVDFVNCSISLTNLLQILNEIESQILSKNISKILDNLDTLFLSNQPLDSLVTAAKEVLEKMKKNENSTFMSAHSTLSTFINKSGADRELTAICLASIVRFAARNLNDAHLGEELLVSLSKKLATIIKSIFNESREIIIQINSVIDVNLEFVNDIALNETNYFLSTAKNIEELDTESEDYVSNQQLFFESLCSLPTPLKKLATTCSKEEAKNQIEEFVDKIEKIGERFSRWLNQFYLTLFSMIHFRSEMIIGALSFPMSLFCSSNQQDQIKEIHKCFTNIQNIIRSTPEVIFGDVKDVIALIGQIIELSKFGNDFITLVKSNAQSPLFPLYKQSADTLSEIIVDLPSYTLPLQHTIDIDNQGIFVCSLLSFVNCSLQLTKSVIINENGEVDASLYQMLSAPFTYIFFVDAIINKDSTKSNESLKSSSSSLRTRMEVVNLIAVQLAIDDQISEAVPLSDEFKHFLKAMYDLLSCILALKQPTLQYDIPDDILEFRKFNSISSSFHSKQLKETANLMMETMKMSTNANVKFALSKWFDSTQISTVNWAKYVSNFKNSISSHLKDPSKSSKTAFIEGFVSLSVCIAANDESYVETVAPIVVQLHRNIIKNVAEILESTSDNEKERMMDTYIITTKISSYHQISGLKREKEKDEFLSVVVKNLIISLQNVRQKMKTKEAISIDDRLLTIDSIEQLSSFFSIYETKDDFGLSLLLNETLRENDESLSQILDTSIGRLSEKLLQLEPGQYALLYGVTDKDSISDFIYDKAEAFRDNVNVILQLVKSGEESGKKVEECLKAMLLSACDAGLLVTHSLKLRELANTQLSATFVAAFSDLQMSLRQFTDSSFLIHKKKDDKLQTELRKVNRVMVKQFDTFINFIEDPQNLLTQTFSEQNGFEDEKFEMFVFLSEFIVQIARLIALSVTSLVPEMYEKPRLAAISGIKDSLSVLQAKIANLLKKAVGQTSSEFGILSTRLESETSVFIDASEKVTFGVSFVPLPILQPCENICSVTRKMVDVGLLLTDKIIIEPDPEAASRVPDDYEMPSPPKIAPAADAAYDSLVHAEKSVTDSLVRFKEVNENDVASSKQLLESLSKLRESSGTFIEKALIMEVATVNPLYQVEQQAALHAFVNALNGLHSALKSRLMRTKLFKSEMADSLSLFTSTIKKSMEFAETASKMDVVDNGDEDANEVTRELNATAAVIELMTAKLKEFEDQVNLTAGIHLDENDFDPENAVSFSSLQEAIDSLPAYLVAAANPILASTTQILRRCQKITSSLLKKYGTIENEKGLIKSAQDLSEAAELLLVCAEILVQRSEKSAEFKAITAAKIINAAVAGLLVQVQHKGGDQEGVIPKHVNTVRRYSESVIRRAEAIVEEKMDIEYKKRQKGPVYVLKLNQSKIVEDLRVNLTKEENALKQFRKKY